MIAVANVTPEKSVFENLEQIATLKANLEQYKKQLVDVEQNQKNPFDEQIEQMLEQINQIEDVPVNNITELETELEHQSMLLKLLNDPKSSVRQAIIDKSISFLNQKIKDYLIKLNSEIIWSFSQICPFLCIKTDWRWAEFLPVKKGVYHWLYNLLLEMLGNV